MPHTETPMASDWKTRYLDLLRQQSTESEVAAETEKLLCRIIIRLTLATSGLDPALDPHLVALRNAVRKGIKGDLRDRLSAISETLIRAKDESLPAEIGEAGLLQRLIARSGLSGRNAAKLGKLAERFIVEGERVSDEQIDSFLLILTRAENRSHPKGLWDRLFSFSSTDSTESDESGITPNQQLLRLLSSLDWPSQLSQDIQRLALELSVRNDGDGWMEVMTSLVTLLASSLDDVHSAIRDTQGFLEELARRLVDIDQHARGSKALREQSRVDEKVLNQVMQHQVAGMRDNMDAATTLHQLRLEIGQKLDTIEAHVQTFMDKENRRHSEAAQLEEHLRQRLVEVQNESRDLRSKMIEAHRQAATDTLTGLPNRLAYEERLEQEFARWRRFGEPLALLVWDVDDFKVINDRFGHTAGDKALRIIGQRLQLGLRETDFVGRFGGEEFIMLLTGSSKEDLLPLVEGIRKGVQESGLHSLGDRVEITVCCGFSYFKEGDAPADVFDRADRALYEAKSAGKNCVRSG